MGRASSTRAGCSRPQLLLIGDVFQPFTSFVVFLWAHSSTFTCFLNYGAQSCTHYSRGSHTNAEYQGMTASFDELVILSLRYPGMRSVLLAARTLLTDVEYVVKQHPQIPFYRAAPQPFLSYFILLLDLTSYPR